MNLKFTILVLVVASDFIFTTAWGKYSAKKTAAQLKKRYNDLTMKCYDKSSGEYKPTFMCSGIMMRGVAPNHGLPHAWSMKLGNQISETFSVAYLRKDAQFGRFPKNYDTGYIIYPQLKTPKKKNPYKIFCAFPLDAHTDNRRGRHGCGRSRDDPTGESDLCQKQGITTFGQWKDHFDKRSSHITKLCGFDMRRDSPYKTFQVVLKANKYIMQQGGKHTYRNNELRMHMWNEEKAEKIPIEAFFFLKDLTGPERAEKYRADFKRAGGGDVPIVAIHLPKAEGSQEFMVEPHHQKRKRH